MRSWREWRLVARAASLMTGLAVARVLPYATWRRLGLRLGRLRTGDQADALVAGQILRAVNTASRIVPGGSNCLVRALTARALLARQGMRSELLFGVARDPGGALRAHAWLRYEGELVLGDQGVHGFAPMPDLADRV